MHIAHKARTTPAVVNGQLYWWEDFFASDARYTVPVGSAAWFAWLEQPGNTTFYFDNVVMEFTARRETRRDNFYWYAYKKWQGKTYKAYIGPSAKLDLEKLRNAAERLYQKI